MIQSNRVTIIPSDGAVYLDEWVYINLDLSDCGIPGNVQALQWLNGSGHIEDYSNEVDNIPLTVLPEWALRCIDKWEQEFVQNPPTPENP